MTLDDAARAAVEKHRRLLCHKTMELALGELVALDGIRAVRRVLLGYLVQLRWYR